MYSASTCNAFVILIIYATDDYVQLNIELHTNIVVGHYRQVETCIFFSCTFVNVDIFNISIDVGLGVVSQCAGFYVKPHQDYQNFLCKSDFVCKHLCLNQRDTIVVNPDEVFFQSGFWYVAPFNSSLAIYLLTSSGVRIFAFVRLDLSVPSDILP